MHSKTRIIVLHIKELIYTGIFAILGILFIILLIMMFMPKNKDKETSADVTAAPTASYIPGIYTTSLIINDNAVDIEVTVDETSINDIRIVNLDETIATMYPLIEPAFEDLAAQICAEQSLDNITYADDNKYTSLVLLDAIRASLDKATPTPSAEVTSE